MHRRHPHTTIFFPIGLISLSVLPIIICSYCSTRSEFHRSWAIELVLPYFDQSEREFTSIWSWDKSRLTTYAFTHSDFEMGHKIDTLRRACLVASTKRSQRPIIRVMFAPDCTYGEFVQALDCFITAGLGVRSLLHTNESRYSILCIATFDDSEVASRPQRSASLSFSKRLFQGLTSCVERVQPIVSGLREHPQIYILLYFWLLIVVLNIRRLLQITRQRRQLTNSIRRSLYHNGWRVAKSWKL